MTRASPSLAALALLALLVLPSALAKEEDAAPSSYGSMDGVVYYMASGMVNGSRLASDPGTGDTPLDFTGCAFVQLRPELDRGRISISGFVDGFTPVNVEVGDFAGDAGGQGPIGTNLTVDQAYLPVLPAGKAARAEVAGIAPAEMKAAEYLDLTQTPPRLVTANFTDPVSGAEELRAILAMSVDGVRDDATGALGQVDQGDPELHVVLTSPEGVQPKGDTIHFTGPSNLPDGSQSAEAEHVQTYEFLNTRFGGTGTLAFEATSKAPPGFNAVTVVLRAPDGSEAGNASVEWSALQAGAATIEFAADQMGFYTIVVTGKLLLGTYGMEIALAAPPAFRLDFWWEDVVRGDLAQNAYGDCQREIGMRAQVVAGRVERSNPPTFPLKVVILSVAVAAATALIVVKLVQDQVSSGEFRKQFK